MASRTKSASQRGRVKAAKKDSAVISKLDSVGRSFDKRIEKLKDEKKAAVKSFMKTGRASKLSDEFLNTNGGNKAAVSNTAKVKGMGKKASTPLTEKQRKARRNKR